MTKFRILDQGREEGKDEWYANCLYGEHDRPVTVIVSEQVLEYLKMIGVFRFSVVIEGALEAAQGFDWDSGQVVV